MSTARFAHGGNIYGANTPMGGWLDFSANINPLGLSPSVSRAIADAMPGIVHYPDPEGTALKAALSSFYDVPTDCIVLGNGGAELFYVWMQQLRPKRVLLPVPSFSEYERAALSVGATVDYFYLDAYADFHVDADALIKALPGHDCLLLGNPNNPTATLFASKDGARLFAAAQQEGVHVLFDESFLDFREDRMQYTMMPLATTSPQILVVQSLTKFYAIPGLRLGFGVAMPALIRRMERGTDPWHVNLLAQAAGVAALSDTAYQTRTRQVVEEERAWLFSALSALPDVKVYAPSVNFILLRLGASWGDATSCTAAMRTRGILIRDCTNYPGLGLHADRKPYIRVAVKCRKDNECLVEAFRAIKNDNKSVS